MQNVIGILLAVIPPQIIGCAYSIYVDNSLLAIILTSSFAQIWGVLLYCIGCEISLRKKELAEIEQRLRGL